MLAVMSVIGSYSFEKKDCRGGLNVWKRYCRGKRSVSAVSVTSFSLYLSKDNDKLAKLPEQLNSVAGWSRI